MVKKMNKLSLKSGKVKTMPADTTAPQPFVEIKSLAKRQVKE
jgi:hypothetical protein